MACIELKLNEGISVSFEADIPLTSNSVISYLKNNQNIEYILNGELQQGNLYDYLVNNLSGYLNVNSDNFADTLIGNYKLADTYYELEGTDYNIWKVDSKSYISQNYFVSPNRIFAIANESNLDIVEKVFYIYNQLQNDVKSFVDLVEELGNAGQTLYEKFSNIVNSNDDRKIKLLKKVPSKHTQELLTIGKDTFVLNKGVWEDLNGKKIEDSDSLWNSYFKQANSVTITPITLEELKNYDISGSNEFYTRGNTKITFNGNEFIDEFGKPVSEDTIIEKINNPSESLLLREMDYRTPVSYGRLRYLVDTYLSDYINEDTIAFTDENNPYIYDGKVYLKEKYQATTQFAEIAIPIILNKMLGSNESLELINNGEPQTLNNLLDALLDFYINGDDIALSGYENVDDIQWVMNEIDKVLDNSDLKDLRENEVSQKPVKDISEQLRKKLLDDGNLMVYCVI